MRKHWAQEKFTAEPIMDPETFAVGSRPQLKDFFDSLAFSLICAALCSLLLAGLAALMSSTEARGEAGGNVNWPEYFSNQCKLRWKSELTATALVTKCYPYLSLRQSVQEDAADPRAPLLRILIRRTDGKGHKQS